MTFWSVVTCIAFSIVRISSQPGMIASRLSALVRLAGKSFARVAPTLAPSGLFVPNYRRSWADDSRPTSEQLCMTVIDGCCKGLLLYFAAVR